MYVIGIIVVGGILFLLAAMVVGRGEEQPALPRDGASVELPADRVTSGSDVRELMLPVAVRGYRMAEVDWVLAKLADAIDDRDLALEQRDTEIRRLQGDYARSSTDDDR